MSARDTDLNQFVGIPFEERNCYELFRLMYRDLFGIALPDQPYNSAHPRESANNANLIRAEAVGWIPVPAGREQFGDAVILHIGLLPCHIGFVIGGGKMIHSQEKTFSVPVSYRNSLDWRDREKAFYRHPVLA